MGTLNELLKSNSRSAAVTNIVDRAPNNWLVNSTISDPIATQDNLGNVGKVSQSNLAGINKSQTIKGQVEASTDNKVPRIYGRVTTGGIVTDMVYTNSDTTLTVCLVLSEYNADTDKYPASWFNNAGTYEPQAPWYNGWSLDNVYRDNNLCVFGDGTVGNEFSSVKFLRDLDTLVDTNIANKIHVRVYAGGSEAAYQIFPSSNSSGYTDLGNAWTFMPGWTSANTMADLVFAIVQIDYDDTVDITDFGNFQFDIGNEDSEIEYNLKLNFPGRVMYDYLTNTRYGLGIDPAVVDAGAWTPNGLLGSPTDSFLDWVKYSAEHITWKDTRSGTGYITDDRHRFNGVIDPQVEGKQNLDVIGQTGGGYLRYNHRKAKWDVIYNQLFSTTSFTFDNTNILSSVRIQNIDIYSMANAIEVKFPNYRIRDAVETVYLEMPSIEITPNEPLSIMSVTYPAITNRARALNQGLKDLRQARNGMTATFTADYSALQVDVGDLVYLDVPELIIGSESVYGDAVTDYWRVIRLSERVADDSPMTVDVVLRRYHPWVFLDGLFEDTFNSEDATNEAERDITYTQHAISEYVIADGSAQIAYYYDVNGTLTGNTSTTSAAVIYNSLYEPTDSWFGVKVIDIDTTQGWDEAELRLAPISTENVDPFVTVEYIRKPAGNNPISYITAKSEKLTDLYNYNVSLTLLNRDQFGDSQPISINTTVSMITHATPVTGDTYGVNTHLSSAIGASFSVNNANNTYQNLGNPYEIDMIPASLGNWKFEITSEMNYTPPAESFDDVAFNVEAKLIWYKRGGTDTDIFEMPLSTVYGGYEYNDVTEDQLTEVSSYLTAPRVYGEFNSDAGYYGMNRRFWRLGRLIIQPKGYNTLTNGTIDNVNIELYSRDALDRNINPGWYPE